MLIRNSSAPDQVVLSSKFNRCHFQTTTSLDRALLKLTSHPSSTDGGLTCIGIATLLVSACRILLKEGCWSPTLIDQLERGMALAEQTIINKSRRIALSDLPSMKLVVLSMLHPNVISFTDAGDSTQRKKVASAVLDALLSSLDPENAEPCVHVLPVEGSDCQNSFSAPDTVLMDIPMPTGMEVGGSTSIQAADRASSSSSRMGGSHGVGMVLALFDTSLETLQSLRSTTTTEQISEPSLPPPQTVLSQAEMFVKTMVALKVNIVASQKIIPRRLKRKLHAAGVVPLERLSLRFVRAVACISGAQVLGHAALNLLWKEENKEMIQMFGMIQSICVRRIGIRNFLQLKGYPGMSRPLSTLVLRAPCKHSLRELELSVQCSLQALPFLFRAPYVCSQSVSLQHVADALRASMVQEGSSSSRRRRNQGWRLLADVFEQAGVVASEQYMESGLAITELYLQELKRAVDGALTCVRTIA